MQQACFVSQEVSLLRKNAAIAANCLFATNAAIIN